MKASPNSGNGIYNNPWSSINTFEALKRALNLTILNNKNEIKKDLKNFLLPNLNLHDNMFCECLTQLNHICYRYIIKFKTF